MFLLIFMTLVACKSTEVLLFKAGKSTEQARKHASIVVVGRVSNASFTRLGSTELVDFICTLQVLETLKGIPKANSLTAYSQAKRQSKFPQRGEVWLFAFNSSYDLLVALPDSPKNRLWF